MMMMEQKFDPGTAMAATSTVEVSISCRNLLDKDILSKSDPMCVIYHRPRGSTHWVELLRTEVVKNNLNPDFVQKLTIEYMFEEQQWLRFELYDIDTPSPKLTEQDFLGFVECTLAQIVSAGSDSLSLSLNQTVSVVVTDADNNSRKNSAKDKGGSCGKILLLAEELTSLKDEVTLKLGGNNMGSVTCCLFPPRVYYMLSKVTEGTKYVVVYKSEIVKGPEVSWSPKTLSVRTLCNGDRDRGLKIDCFTNSHKSLGYCLTSLNTLLNLGTGGIKLISSSTSQESRSVLLVLSCKISPIYTFIDYIQNGTQIHCCFSIDFTSSNGDPSDSASLHHFSPSASAPNPYEQAISSVGDIIVDYDSSKLFPVLGFGARIPPHGAVSHNFYVTLQESPYCFGIHGVLEAYRNCIRQIQLYGPTNFAPVIKHMADIASSSVGGEHYYLLLIITDGVITDMPQTKEAIVRAAEFPMSIIIIGVGGADFEAMEELDGDSVRISYGGRFASRDIVQFVPYRDAYSWMATTVGPGAKQQQGNPSNLNVGTHRMAQVLLGQEVLAEIPEQLTSYMKSKGIFPLKKPNTPRSNIN